MDQRHVNLVKLLMHGSKEPEKQYSTAPWLFDVVSQQTNQLGWIHDRVWIAASWRRACQRVGQDMHMGGVDVIIAAGCCSRAKPCSVCHHVGL